MSISTLRMSKKTKASQARMTFPHPSRILHLKPREEKIQRTKLFPIYIQRDSPKMSKTSRSLWAIAAIGIRSRLPEQPSARENHRKSIGSGHQASRCCKEVLSWFSVNELHELPGLVWSLALSLWVDSRRCKASSRDAILSCIAWNRSLAEAGNKSFWPTLQSSFSTVAVGCCQLDAAQSLIVRTVLWTRGRLLCKCLVQNQRAILKCQGFKTRSMLHPAIFPTFCLSICQSFCLPCVFRPTTRSAK